jgi:hypothetical protein
MPRRRLVLYILLNALVSALVTGTILYFYDRANPKANCCTGETIPTIASGSLNASILNANGAGVLASESVSIQNNGSDPIQLSGWMLKDGKGNIYIFPKLTLYPGGTVQVHSGTGSDTAADLYWQLSAPVWKSGSLVALYDTQNIARAFYRVP